MKKIFHQNFICLITLLVVGCNIKEEPKPTPDPIPIAKGPFVYELDLTKISTDSFKIKLNLDALTDQNTIFQFASTIPGTYETLNFGQYVGGFKAYDIAMNRIPVKQAAINQFDISNPQDVRTITYSVKRTFSLATGYGANIFQNCVFLQHQAFLDFL